MQQKEQHPQQQQLMRVNSATLNNCIGRDTGLGMIANEIGELNTITLERRTLKDCSDCNRKFYRINFPRLTVFMTFNENKYSPDYKCNTHDMKSNKL